MVVAGVHPRAPADKVAKLFDRPVAVGRIGVYAVADKQVHHPALHAACREHRRRPVALEPHRLPMRLGQHGRLEDQRAPLSHRVEDALERSSPGQTPQCRQLVPTRQYSTSHAFIPV